jgi:hypothetical protein
MYVYLDLYAFDKVPVVNYKVTPFICSNHWMTFWYKIVDFPVSNQNQIKMDTHVICETVSSTAVQHHLQELHKPNKPLAEHMSRLNHVWVLFFNSKFLLQVNLNWMVLSTLNSSLAVTGVTFKGLGKCCSILHTHKGYSKASLLPSKSCGQTQTHTNRG